MMGRTHALSGPVLTLGGLPVINMLVVAHGMPPVTGYGLVVTAVSSAGGALLPDFDHQHATIAQSVGPVTRFLATFIGAISGGHRNGTHSFVGIAFFMVITWLMSLNPILFGVWMAFLFAVATAALRLQMERATIAHTLICLVAGAALVYFTSTTYIPVYYSIVGVGIGCLAHILGDMMTEQGCPLLWPFVKTRFKFANMTTDHTGEHILFYILLLLFLILVYGGIAAQESIAGYTMPHLPQLSVPGWGTVQQWWSHYIG